MRRIHTIKVGNVAEAAMFSPDIERDYPEIIKAFKYAVKLKLRAIHLYTIEVDDIKISSYLPKVKYKWCLEYMLEYALMCEEYLIAADLRDLLKVDFSDFNNIEPNLIPIFFNEQCISI